MSSLSVPLGFTGKIKILKMKMYYLLFFLIHPKLSFWYLLQLSTVH